MRQAACREAAMMALRESMDSTAVGVEHLRAALAARAATAGDGGSDGGGGAGGSDGSSSSSSGSGADALE
jgi:hypothetical protein